MEITEQSRFDKLYKRHLRALKLQGLSDSTIDVYSRAVRRLAAHFDGCPDRLSIEQLEGYFAELVESHSWSTVKVDRNGLQFFWKHVLKRDWTWLDIVKAPKVQTLPDILTPTEVEQLIGATRKLRYRVFLLATYSMGLRLLWQRHRHPRLLFPNPTGAMARIRQAYTPMDRGGTQAAMKAVVRACGIKKKSPSIPCATALPPIC